MDLEDRFLNPKDPFDSDSDDRGCESDCDDHDHSDLNPLNVVDTEFDYQAPLRPHGNTGVKGVLEDYKEAKRKMIIRREYENEKLKKIAEKNSFTCMTSREEEMLEHQEEQNKQELEELVENDEEFFRKYREMRLQQYRDSQWKKYGKFGHITRDEFLKTIDEEPPTTWIVIHLYEPDHPACMLTNEHLQVLAKKHPRVKFVKAISTDLKPDWDPIALPSLLVYRGGKYVNSFIRITEDLGPRFTLNQLETFLADENIIALPSH